jgi:ADP-heptose:LPS heptosyltransferase
MVSSILVVRPSHLGDIVCTLPLFHALRAAAPDAELGWVVQREFAGLLEGLPGLDRVFRFDRRRGPAAWVSLRRELARFGADLAVDAQGNLKSAMAMLCSGARRKVGLARADWREPAGAFVLDDAAPASRHDEPHAVQRMFALARHAVGALGRDDEFDETTLRTDPGLSERELARGEVLATRYLAGDDAVVVHLAAPNDVRSWPAEHTRRLILALLARGRPVLCLSGPGERPIGVELRRSLGARPGLSHWVGQDNLREACAFFAACGRRDVPLVSCDSGPMHLAAASGMPVVALAGPQDAARTGPWPPPGGARGADGGPNGHRVLRADDPPECAPCLARRCTHAKGPVCMSRIAPEAVLVALGRG